MIFVDTSVWVAAFRGRGATPKEQLGTLLEAGEVALAGPVRLELLSGATPVDLRTLRRTLSALPTYFPTRDTWDLAERWLERTTRAGVRVGVTDLLIGALAAERGCALWSLDADFTRLARLRLLRLHHPES